MGSRGSHERISRGVRSAAVAAAAMHLSESHSGGVAHAASCSYFPERSHINGGAYLPSRPTQIADHPRITAITPTMNHTRSATPLVTRNKLPIAGIGCGETELILAQLLARILSAQIQTDLQEDALDISHNISFVPSNF